ncbi:MAG: permease-like cell division protein FtsX [Thermoleophilia bacterium]
MSDLDDLLRSLAALDPAAGAVPDGPADDDAARSAYARITSGPRPTPRRTVTVRRAVAAGIPAAAVAGVAAALIATGAGGGDGSPAGEVTTPVASSTAAAPFTDSPTDPAARPAAPDVSLPIIKGLFPPLRLGDMRGHAVVLTFTASWCTPCHGAVETLRQLTEEDGLDMNAVAIATNDDEAHAHALLTAADANWVSLAFDRNDVLAKAFDITGVPETFIIDRDGRVATRIPGPIDAASLRKAVRNVINQQRNDVAPAPYRLGVVIVLSDTATEDQIDAIRARIEPLVAAGRATSVRYVSKEEALERFRSRLKDPDAITGNPLPATIEVTAATAADRDAISSAVRGAPGIDEQSGVANMP